VCRQPSVSRKTGLGVLLLLHISSIVLPFLLGLKIKKIIEKLKPEP
jgi:hypothetical protein